MATSNNAKFSIGEVVKHRHFDFRGVIYDVDFEFNNSEEWYQSIPKEVRPRKDQPFYHLLAESNDVTYEAYVSEQNLLLDKSKEPVIKPKKSYPSASIVFPPNLVMVPSIRTTSIPKRLFVVAPYLRE